MIPTPDTLPTLAHVQSLPFERVCLTLKDGQAVTVELEDAPALCCARCPVGPRCCSKTGRMLRPAPTVSLLTCARRCVPRSSLTG